VAATLGFAPKSLWDLNRRDAPQQVFVAFGCWSAWRAGSIPPLDWLTLPADMPGRVAASTESERAIPIASQKALAQRTKIADGLWRCRPSVG